MKGQYDNLGARLAKWLVPKAGALLSVSTAQSALALVELGSQIAQGKGAGSGWDLGSEVEAALRFLRCGATIFDVGANRGEWSLAVMGRLPRDCAEPPRLFLFEPQASCRRHLEPIVSKFSARLIAAAASNRSGTAALYTDSDASGIATLHPRRDTYFEHQAFRTIEVPAVTLDDVIAQERIDLVHYAKLDVEGHELQVLEGAHRALATGRLQALAFEFGSANLNSRTLFRDFWELLVGECGYELHRILPGGRLLPIGRYCERLEHYRGVSNYVATAPNLSATRADQRTAGSPITPRSGHWLRPRAKQPGRCQRQGWLGASAQGGFLR